VLEVFFILRSLRVEFVHHAKYDLLDSGSASRRVFQVNFSSVKKTKRRTLETRDTAFLPMG
jgi:hypothetical protein